MNNFSCFFSLLMCLTLASCTEPITVGSDLVEGELAGIGQVTDIPFNVRTVRDDSLQTFAGSTNQAIGGFTFGETSDEVAGKWRHGLYLVPQPFRNTAGLPAAPLFITDEDTELDSVVLILPIDTSNAFFGLARNFPVMMRLLDAPIDDGQDYYSDVNFAATGPNVSATDAFSARLAERFLYDTIYSGGDTVAFPHIRIPFNDAFITDFSARDTSDFSSEEDFFNVFPGVYLEPGAGTNGLITLLPQGNSTGQTPFAGFYFFYPDTSNQAPRFIRRPLSLWLPEYEKDFSGSLAGELLDAPTDNERGLVTGQAGTMLEINFPDLSSLENTVINQAEIRFHREEVEGYSYQDFATPEFVALYYRDDNGALSPIEDRLRLGNPNNSNSVLRFLGGDPQTDDEGNVFYQPRFSVHMQRMLNGEVPRTIFLRVVPTDRDPSRVVLTGPEAAIRPASIRITFTELD